MKKTLLVAMMALAFVACKNEKKQVEAEAQPADVEVAAAADYAFVDTDYVLSNSEIYKTEGVALRDKNEKSQKKLAQREQNLQKEMQELNNKYQRGLITTRDAEEQSKALQDKAAKFQSSAEKQMKELEEEAIVFQNRLQDLITRAVKQVNPDKKYKFVIQRSALLDADEAYDITNQVLAAMNELYAAEKKKK